MTAAIQEPLQASLLGFLPIVREYAQRMGLIDIINQALDCRLQVDPGTLVVAMIMDVLTGRTPLYRVSESFRHRDTDFLLDAVDPSQLNDDALGRLFDRIWEYGTWQLFSMISLEAFKRFVVECSVINHDTTSVSVWGEYDNQPAKAIKVARGNSKDKRPDLKQFIFSLLCAEGNLPLAASVRDGNASDKTINTTVVSMLPRLMASHGVGQKDFILVVDAALVTEKNLTILGDSGRFITRLPETYNCCDHAIQQAIDRGQWTTIGPVGSPSPSRTRPRAKYRLQEGQVALYGHSYRVVIVHSDCHDKRRQRKLSQKVDKECTKFKDESKESLRREYYCLPDAQQAAALLPHVTYHTLSWTIEKRPVFARGRPAHTTPRQPQSFRYRIKHDLKPNQEAIRLLRERAGCFVLLTSVPVDQLSGEEILRHYKSQDGIERNFSVFKDPLVMNDVFLKNPRRIEALCFILTVALLLWRLMERTMRKTAIQENIAVPGWDNRPTNRPTSFMVASKFSSVMIVKHPHERVLTQEMHDQQLAFLKVLDVHPSIFTQQQGDHYWPKSEKIIHKNSS